MDTPKLTGLRKAAKACGFPYTSLLDRLKDDEELRAATFRIGCRLFVDEGQFTRWIEGKRLGALCEQH